MLVHISLKCTVKQGVVCFTTKPPLFEHWLATWQHCQAAVQNVLHVSAWKLPLALPQWYHSTAYDVAYHALDVLDTTPAQL
jgi:hypothetical protein